MFWFLGALGLGLSLLVLALTPAMVWLFEEPDLFGPLAALAALPLLLSLNAAFAAEMEQREAFGELALAQTVANELLAQGVGFAAIELVHPYLMEVNIANPGGLGTLASLTGVDPTAEVVAALMDLWI